MTSETPPIEQVTGEIPYLERINKALIPILSIKSPNPLVNQLRVYTASSLSDDIRYVSQSTGAMKAKADLLLHEFENEDDVKAGIFRVVAALEKTPYLAQVADENITKGLQSGIDHGKYGANVGFVDPDSKLIRLFQKLTDPHYYNSLFDFALIPGKIPKTTDLWRTLITEGKLPEVIALLDTALVEDHQFSKTQRLVLVSPVGIRFALTNYLLTLPFPVNFIISNIVNYGSIPPLIKFQRRFGNDEVLASIHAEEATFYSPTNMDESQSLGDVKNGIVRKFTKNRQRIKAGIAFDLIHRIRILSDSKLTDLELGKLVSGDKYDKNTSTFPKLQKALNDLEKEWGLNDEGIDKEQIYAAIQARYELDLLRARRQGQETAFKILEEERGRWLKPVASSPSPL